MDNGVLRAGHKQLIEWVLVKSADEPLRVRAGLYGALAEICPEEKDRQALRAMANMLQEAEARCREFVFEFGNKVA